MMSNLVLRQLVETNFEVTCVKGVNPDSMFVVCDMKEEDYFDEAEEF